MPPTAAVDKMTFFRLLRMIVYSVFFFFTFANSSLCLAAEGGDPPLFWTKSFDQLALLGPGTINRVQPDGSGPSTVMSTFESPVGIALDPGNEHIYWSEPWGRVIKRSRLDGSEVVVVLSGLDFPWGLALDHGAGKLYWSEPFRMEIRCANLDGSENREVLRTGHEIRGIALDQAGQKIYWVESFAGNLLRANSDGTGIEILIQNLSSPIDLAIDIPGQRVFWTEFNRGAIAVANLDGSGVTDLLTGRPEPFGIALDLLNQRIFWTEIGVFLKGGNGIPVLFSANMDGSGVTALFTDFGYQGYLNFFCQPPTVAFDSASADFCIGETPVLTPAVTSTGSCRVEWFKDGQPLAIEGASLNLPTIEDAADAGTFSARANGTRSVPEAPKP